MGWGLKIWQWLASHPHTRALVMLFAIGAVGTLVNWLTWFETSEEWRLYKIGHPKRAQVIQVFRALWPHLRKVLKRASPVAAALLPSDPPPASPKVEVKQSDTLP